MSTNKTEELTAEVKKLQDTLDIYSDELLDFMQKQADKSCLNWLVTYGIPETPSEAWHLVFALVRTVPALLIQEEFVTLTSKAVASAEEVTERRDKRANVQQSLFDTLGAAVKSPSQVPGFGQYL